MDDDGAIDFLLVLVLGLLGESLKRNSSFLHQFQPFFPFVLEFLQPTSTEAEMYLLLLIVIFILFCLIQCRTAVLCLLDDVVEGTGKQASSLFPLIMPAYNAGIS